MSDKKKSNPVVNFIIRVAVSGGLLWYIFSKIDVQKTVEVLRSADLGFIVMSAVVFFGINLIVLFRWNLFVQALDLTVATFSVVRYFFVGLFGNLFLPSAIGGDIIKIIGLCRESGQKPRVVASVLLDRLSGFAGLVIVSVISFIFSHGMFEDNSMLVPILGIGLGSFAIALVLFNERVYGFFCGVFNFIPKLKNWLMNVHYDVMLLGKNKQKGFQALGVSCAAHIILCLTYYLLALGLHQEVNVFYFFIFVPLISVASSFPSIGGLGVREVGAVFLFSKIGVGSEISVSMTLLVYLFMVFTGTFGGLFYMLTKSPAVEVPIDQTI